jgi:hypothetical protein
MANTADYLAVECKRRLRKLQYDLEQLIATWECDSRTKRRDRVESVEVANV